MVDKLFKGSNSNSFRNTITLSTLGNKKISRQNVNLKMPTTTAAEDVAIYYYYYFSDKILICHVHLLSLKNNNRERERERETSATTFFFFFYFKLFPLKTGFDILCKLSPICNESEK